MIQSADQSRYRSYKSGDRDCCGIVGRLTYRLGDTHLAQQLLRGAYPQERLLELDPYAEERGQCNGVALGIGGLLSQTSSRVTRQTALGMSKGIRVLSNL